MEDSFIIFLLNVPRKNGFFSNLQPFATQLCNPDNLRVIYSKTFRSFCLDQRLVYCANCPLIGLCLKINKTIQQT